MKNLFVSELKNKIGDKVNLEGWLHGSRILGNIAFIFLRDGTGIVQIVLEDKKLIKRIKNLQAGSIINVSGLIKKSQSKAGFEILAETIEVKREVKEALPVDITKHELHANLDTILDFRALTLRNEKESKIFKLQALILEVFRKFLKEHNFTEFVSPVLMGAPSESGADVFEVNYFKNKAYLAQSPQVYKQIMVGVFERVFTIAKVFRAEKHNTSRHIMEITQLDAEMGFIEDYYDVMNIAEGFICELVQALKKKQDYFELDPNDLPVIPDDKFPVVKVKKALEIIEERTGKSASRDELDVDPEDEKEIALWAKEKFNSDFVWLINFKKDKNFYTYNDFDRAGESLSYDLIFRGLEILSGTHRIEDYDLLVSRMKKQGLDLENYKQYLLAFKYGMPKHGGFSFGLERLTQKLLNLDNIRYSTLFPTDLKRIASSKIKRAIISGKENIFNAIIDILKSSGVDYKLVEHEETIGVKDSESLGIDPKKVVKSLILKGKKQGKNILVVVRGDQKVDMAKLASLVGERLTFEKPEVMKMKWGLDVGEVPPFGHLLGLDVFFDKRILETDKILFTIADKAKSIEIDPHDLVKLLDAKIV